MSLTTSTQLVLQELSTQLGTVVGQEFENLFTLASDLQSAVSALEGYDTEQLAQIQANAEKVAEIINAIDTDPNTPGFEELGKILENAQQISDAFSQLAAIQDPDTGILQLAKNFATTKANEIGDALTIQINALSGRVTGVETQISDFAAATSETVTLARDAFVNAVRANFTGAVTPAPAG